jgi:hypothetical protein
MGLRVVGLYSQPWEKEDVNKSSARRTPHTLYRRAIWSKANPRNESYMQVLFAERYPEGIFLNIDQTVDWRMQTEEADKIILLYPDSIGLGFAAIESEIERLKKPWAGVRVLNGRRRDFLLNETTRRRLRRRRFLERTMIVEFAVMVAMLLVTPFLIGADFIRGRR